MICLQVINGTSPEVGKSTGRIKVGGGALTGGPVSHETGRGLIYVNPRRHKVPHFGADTPLSTGECPSPVNAILNERRGDFRSFNKKKSRDIKNGDKYKSKALGASL